MNANQTLKLLLSQILKHGNDVPSRVGNTKELTFESFPVTDPQRRYITLPERKVSVPAQIAETMWVLSGRNDTEWLSAYLPQAPKFTDDGKHWRAGYGPRLRNFGEYGESGEGTDQIKNVIELLRKDPTTRRAVISLWDPLSDVVDSKDIPCNNWLHFLARDGKLHLNIAIRSNDLMWGWSGINFFEWSVLLEIVAKHTALLVGDLYFNVSSLHLYERHFEKSKRIISAPIDCYGPPGDLVSYGANWEENAFQPDLDEMVRLWFELEAQVRAGQLLNIEKMPDPLLWSWLWALAYYWGHETVARRMLTGLDILPALELSPKRKQPVDLDGLVSYMQKLHTEKSAAYGDSWKKRGELFSIIPNIARKVDRILAQTETSDETKIDTAMDLVIYLAKYRCWLAERGGNVYVDVADENASIDYVVRTFHRGMSEVQEEVFQQLLDDISKDLPRDLTAFLTQAVGYLVKLWSGPEGRSMRNPREAALATADAIAEAGAKEVHARRNEKRSWNPDYKPALFGVEYAPGGVVDA